MFKSLKVKLLIISLLVVLTIITAIIISDILDTRERLVAVQKEKVTLLSDMIKQSIMLLMLENKWHQLQKLLEDLTKHNSELKEVSIFHPVTGRIIASNKVQEVGKIILEKDWQRFKNKEEGPFIITKGSNMFATRVTAIANMPTCYKCHPPAEKILGVLDVEISLAIASESIKALTYKHITGLLVGFFVITAIFLIVAERLINRPLQDLIEVIKKVQSGDLSVKAKEIRDDEFGYLSSSFNKMIESLASAQKEIQRCHMQQLQRASKLASIGTIVSGIAHEIKNPLAGISCAIQVINAEISNDDSRKPIIVEILQQVNRLDRIVKDLLSYSKPKPPLFVRSKINSIVDKALFFVYTEAKKQNIVMHNQVSSEIPEVKIDPDQIHQVFLNIIINAIHAMPNGGTLTISASVKDKQDVQDEINRSVVDDKFIAIEFQDTGIGISPEDLPNIFEPFFTKKTKGTGLGLSISRKIVHDHYGEITVQSEFAKGTKFTVYLPLRG